MTEYAVTCIQYNILYNMFFRSYDDKIFEYNMVYQQLLMKKQHYIKLSTNIAIDIRYHLRLLIYLLIKTDPCQLYSFTFVSAG